MNILNKNKKQNNNGSRSEPMSNVNCQMSHVTNVNCQMSHVTNVNGQMSHVQKGFSLIELIIYIAIATLLFSVVVSFGVNSYRMKNKNQSMFIVEGQGLTVMQKILTTIRNSEGVANPVSGSSTTLTLNILDALKDPTIFNFSNETVTITEGAGTPKEMFDSNIIVSDFLVENLSRNNTSGNIRVIFTLQGNNYTRTFYGNATVR